MRDSSMIEEDPVIIELNILHDRQMLQLERLTDDERRRVSNLLAECVPELARFEPEFRSPADHEWIARGER
jgi:hypothetical protein